MARQKTFSVSVAAVVVLSVATVLQANTKVVVSHRVAGVVIRPPIGFGIWLGRPPNHHHTAGHRKLVVTGPWRRRFVALGSPHGRRVTGDPRAVKVVHAPVEKHIVIGHTPTVTVKTPAVIERGPVTVWVTNSNGSRTSVRLTRRGPWYIGPRGEYYTEMPTNEQLRVVYGF